MGNGLDNFYGVFNHIIEIVSQKNLNLIDDLCLVIQNITSYLVDVHIRNFGGDMDEHHNTSIISIMKSYIVPRSWEERVFQNHINFFVVCTVIVVVLN